MYQPPRHKVFVSFHHNDQVYKDWFIRMMDEDIVDQSVGDGDIDDNLSTDTIRQRIRDNFIQDATVTIVLVGPCTWQRKHVDWEIGSSLRNTKNNSRCGLLGIILPNHPNHGLSRYNPRLIPPRLADNHGQHDPYASIYHWQEGMSNLKIWIHHVFQRRHRQPSPNNSRPQFKYNKSGRCDEGWKD